MPDLDVSLRGAVSIARRLQDPLAELVKIDPKSIGVGQYQHDVNQSELARTLDAVVEDCVNAVGVDLNTACVPLLTRVSGLGRDAGRERSCAAATSNGAFRSRQQLLEVPRPGRQGLRAGAPASCASAAATTRWTCRACTRRPIRWCEKIAEATGRAGDRAHGRRRDCSRR